MAQFRGGGLRHAGNGRKERVLVSYVDVEEHIAAQPTLRKIWQIVNDALASLDEDFDHIYFNFGDPPIMPKRLIWASLLQMLFRIRS